MPNSRALSELLLRGWKGDSRLLMSVVREVGTGLAQGQTCCPCVAQVPRLRRAKAVHVPWEQLGQRSIALCISLTPLLLQSPFTDSFYPDFTPCPSRVPAPTAQYNGRLQSKVHSLTNRKSSSQSKKTPFVVSCGRVTVQLLLLCTWVTVQNVISTRSDLSNLGNDLEVVNILSAPLNSPQTQSLFTARITSHFD